MQTFKKPDFLGIGAYKSGSSWLYAQLKQHPDVWMPPLKELHYFDRDPRYPSPDYLALDRLLERMLVRGRLGQTGRRWARRRLNEIVRKQTWHNLPWVLRYLTGTYDFEWYASLFKAAGDRVAGEITPDYALLDKKDVKAIYKAWPHLKVLYVIRNPIRQAFSHVRFVAGKHDIDLYNAPLEVMQDMINTPRMQQIGDYLKTIQTWRSVFPDDQFWLGYFEQTKRHPKRQLLSVYEFLGIRADEQIVPEDADEPVFVSPPMDMPRELQVWLAERELPKIRALAAELGGQAEIWLHETENLLNQSS